MAQICPREVSRKRCPQKKGFFWEATFREEGVWNRDMNKGLWGSPLFNKNFSILEI